MARKAGKASGVQQKEKPRKYPRIDERAAANFVSLQEIVATARRNLPQDLWDHLSGGSDSETTLLRNRQALDSLALRQRVLVDVRKIDITTTLLGRKLASPVFLAPVGGFVGFAHPEGACKVARAAVAHGTTAFISTAARPSLEAAAAAVNEPLIFQLYVRADRKWVEDILDRAKASGYRALCVCVDRNYYGRRERDIISRANVREGFGDPSFQMGLQWKDLVWMKQHWKVPLIVKGVATAEDAKLSVEHGADVVYVSNHGGRQLDHAQGTIEVLPEVVAAVDGRAEILVGWRRAARHRRGERALPRRARGRRRQDARLGARGGGGGGLEAHARIDGPGNPHGDGTDGRHLARATQSVLRAPGAAGAPGEPDERLPLV